MPAKLVDQHEHQQGKRRRRQKYLSMHMIALFLAIVTLFASCVTAKKVSRKNRNSANDTADDASNFRLPSHIRPIHYQVRLQPFIHGNQSIHGEVEVELEVLKPTSRIVFHITDILIKNSTVKVSSLNNQRLYPVRRQRYNSRKEQYSVQLRRRLRQGNAYLLALEFVATLSNSTTEGFYISSYIHEGETRKVAATQFWPDDARRAFPCFDEPAMKATFDVYLAREDHMTAISNMPVVRTVAIDGQDGWVWDQFATSLNMSTYLVAFVITEFAARSTADDGDGGGKTAIQVWSRHAVQDQTSLALNVSKFSLAFFEEYFGLAYPLRKMDMVALLETTFNAMENWGLVTYRESVLLADSESSSASHRSEASVVVAHEMAHQWFGNLVTFKWWTDLWLNEGFATYMATLAVNELQPSWGLLDQFVVTEQQHVMALDALITSHPVSVPVPNPAEIYEVFGNIPYKKGASIIRMMQHFLTEATFKKGLTQYLTSMSYSNADQDDLWTFMTKAAHEDGALPGDLTIKTIMDTWTLQEGFPVITVTRDHKGTAKVTQDRFLLNAAETSESESEKSFRWWIPVTFTSQKRPTFRHTRAQTWLSSHADHVTVTGLPPPQFWVIFNLQMTGYYRVNYDEYNWNLLAYQLQEDHEVIHVTNRAQIIDDAFSLARAGLLSYASALDITAYLKAERSYVTWKATFNYMQFLHLMFRHTAVFGALKDYFLSLLEPMYETLGFDDQVGEDLQTQLLRREVVQWACRLHHSDCVNKSLSLFRDWMEDPYNPSTVSPNVAEAVYCAAVHRGDQKVWEFAWEQFQTTSNLDQRQALGEALGCASQVWLLARYLEASMQSSYGIHRQDALHVFKAVAKSDVGSLLAWHYLRTNFKHVAEYAKGDYFMLKGVVKAATQHFNTEQQLKQLQQLLEDTKTTESLKSATSTLAQATEATEINVAWRKRNFQTIDDWLSQQGFSHSLVP